MRAAFPLLLSNALGWLGAPTAPEAASLRTGRSLRVVSPEGDRVRRNRYPHHPPRLLLRDLLALSGLSPHLPPVPSPRPRAEG